jgi:hypothetical protein
MMKALGGVGKKGRSHKKKNTDKTLMQQYKMKHLTVTRMQIAMRNVFVRAYTNLLQQGYIQSKVLSLFKVSFNIITDLLL